eukprot:3902708-Prymnesium_polylepis.1
MARCGWRGTGGGCRCSGAWHADAGGSGGDAHDRCLAAVGGGAARDAAHGGASARAISRVRVGAAAALRPARVGGAG